jgi:acetyl-CoA acetyltransferase family protein
MNNLPKVLLLEGSRTPILEFGAKAARLQVQDLLGHTMRHVMMRGGINPERVSGVVVGHAFQNPTIPNTGRITWQLQGFPDTTPAETVQIQCGSGMKAVNIAMDRIRLGYGDLWLAGGGESMSTACYVIDGMLRFKGTRRKPYTQFASLFAKGFMPKVIDALARRMGNGWTARQFNAFFAANLKYGPRPYIGVAEDPFQPLELVGDLKTVNMAGTAQNVAVQCKISREEMDAFSLRSQQLALAAIKSNRFAAEIDPIFDGKEWIFNDQHPRETSLEKLAKLRGVNGNRDMTAGNSSGINDGACMLALCTEEYAASVGAKPLAVLVDHVTIGREHQTMGLGPVNSSRELLRRNGLTVDDIDIWEINEAFAAQAKACINELGLNMDKVNLNGGAIALGHPIGMSGARVILTAAHELKKRKLKRAIATLCIGGGMGIATLIENPEAE